MIEPPLYTDGKYICDQTQEPIAKATGDAEARYLAAAGTHFAAVANLLARRAGRLLDGERFDTYCAYTHGLVRTGGAWKISKVKQTVYWNTGNPDIHGGARRR